MIDFDYIDHVAYAFKTIKDGYNFFEPHPGFQVCKGPGINRPQSVRFLFVKVDGIGTVEILSPLDTLTDSPLDKQLMTSGPGFNHICYAVSSMEDSINCLQGLEWKIECNPTPDIAFSGRRIAFLKHKDFGLIELVESKWIFDANMDSPDYHSHEEYTKSNKNNNALEQSHPELTTEVPSQIIELLNNSVDGSSVSNHISSFEEIDDWDSLSQAIFHSLFESLAETKLDIAEFDRLERYIIYHESL